MLVISSCCGGFVGLRNAGRCFSSALTATEVTLTAVSDAARRTGANNGGRQTAATNKVAKVGLTIAIVSGSIVSDTTHPPSH